MRFIDTSRIRTRFDERVVCEDGVELSVDLYFPPEPGHYPVLLNRTPADNNRPGRAGVTTAPAERWKVLAAHGFIVAAADVRGRGDSGGKFLPFINEAADGAATAAWLRLLSECSGKIGVFGSGYGAYCAWAAAVADCKLDAVASISPFGAVGEGLVHRGGSVRLDWLFWMHLAAGRTVQPANAPPWARIYRRSPLAALDDALGREDIWWRDWLNHLDRSDPYWSPLELAESIAILKAPALHVTGWWDGQASAAYRYYEAARRSGAYQQLIIGPWDTFGVRHPISRVGGFDFGPRSMLDIDEVLVEFFDACLRNRSVPAVPGPRVFITGRNEWIVGDECFDESGKTLQLHLSSNSGANTRRGDGILSETSPSDGGIDVITHDPEMPVEFQPQFVSFATGENSQSFTLDQTHITSRDEALVYTSAPLERPITVVGRPRVTLMVRTTALDADLFVLLSDTFPVGVRDLNLGHAAVRLATLESFRAGSLLRIELELDRVAHDFLPNHQIRLTVIPSLFPLYARNPQVEHYSTAVRSTIADIELHHGPNLPALLSLPLASDVVSLDAMP